MKNRWFDLKRGLKAAVLLLATAGIVFCASNSEAATINKTRGRISLDLDTFTLVESTDPDDSGLKPTDSSHSKYKLYYENSFTDRNNIGCTYRSQSKYDLTDVLKIGLFALHPADLQGDKVLFYVNSDGNKFYHRIDDNDLDQSYVDGNGVITSIQDFNWGVENYYEIDRRYTSEYVFIGLSHAWDNHEAVLYIDNKTIDSDAEEGCINLVLKQHNITLLESEKPAQVVVDENGNSKVETFHAFGDVKMMISGSLDKDGCSANESDIIYRDETVSLKYSLADAGICELKSFKFYSDKDKKNLIYEMEVSGVKDDPDDENDGAYGCTFTFNSSLIKKLEDTVGDYNLGDIYLEPVFEMKEVTVDFSDVVVESNGKAEVVVKSINSDGAREYTLRETDSKAVIGTFKMNQAHQVGDTLTLDYEPDKSYDGDYTFNYYEYRMCQSENQVGNTDPSTVPYSEDKVDISNLYLSSPNRYIKIYAHISLDAEVTLKDKTVTFNNKEVYIDDAVVTWPEGHDKPTGNITYSYYTKETCTDADKMKKDEFPVNAGTYYVKAVMGQDDRYLTTTSNVAVITIEKATPVLENLRGTDIVYGQSTIESTVEKYLDEATNIFYNVAYSVEGNEIAGTFTWVSETGTIPNAGTAKEAVLFTPASGTVWENNYMTAAGEASITVKQAKPTVTAESVTKVFDGQMVESVPAKAVGMNNEETGQKMSYDFYEARTIGGYKDIDPPTEAGEYYASAYVSANTNYTFAESEKVKVTIEKRECDMVIVPIGNSTYRIYITNTVAGFKPKGTVNLVVYTDEAHENGVTLANLAISEDENGRYYAECILQGQPSLLDASYISGAKDNYEVSGRTLDIFNESSTNHQDVELTYGDAAKNIMIVDNPLIASAMGELEKIDKVTWLNLDNINSGDVVTVEAGGTDYGSKLIVTEIKNAGSTTAVACVDGITTSGDVKNWYLFYDITVNPAPVTIAVPEKTTVYSGNPVLSDTATVSYKDEGAEKDITSEVTVAYQYYTDQECTNEVTKEVTEGETTVTVSSAPVNVGTYYVKAISESQRNYQAGEGVGVLIIHPAEPTITFTEETIIYDGQAHGLAEPTVTGIDGNVIEDAVTDASRIPQGTVELCYCGKAECPGGLENCPKPVNAGSYTVTAIYTPGENDNYAQTAENRKTAALTIEPASCAIELEPLETVYDGVAAQLNTLNFQGINSEESKEEVALVKCDCKEDCTDWKDEEGNTYTFMYSASTELNFSAEVPSEAGLYYVYAVRQEGGNYKKAISNTTTLLISQTSIEVTFGEDALIDGITTTYSGAAIDMNTISPAIVMNNEGNVIENVEVSYQYYADENAMVKIDTPVNAGTYYVQAIVPIHQSFYSGESEVVKVMIQKATPTLSNLKATDVVYGTELGATTITGKATGVGTDGTLNGTFECDGEAKYEKPEVTYNSHKIPVVFIPDADASLNYTEAYGTTFLYVQKYKPEISCSDKTVVYDGKKHLLDTAEIIGAEGMKEPVGPVDVSYYTSEDCSYGSWIKDVGEGLSDAGTYYCEISYLSYSENYESVRSIYTLEIEKADAVIELHVPTLGKDKESGDIIVSGVLTGVFDDPTGSVTIYQKESGQSEDAYKEVTAAEIKEQNGKYVFSTTFTANTGTYDFKAVYNEGTKKNYNIADGVQEAVDMSKNPQYIYFDEQLIVKEYGGDDFELSVVDENNGSGKVTYRLLENVGDSDVITVSEDGKVQIKDTGKAFVMAVKAGDDDYSEAYAFAAIQVEKAQVEISLADKTVTYTGKKIKIDEAVQKLSGKVLDAKEKLQIVYKYEHTETGWILDECPVEAGVYKVTAYIKQSDHYTPSTKIVTATLTIEKAQAEITLEADHVNKKNKTVTLQGYLSGVLNTPMGTITLYQKVSSQPDSEYAAAAENIQIELYEDGNYGFSVTVSAELDQIYDFKAVYEDAEFENYIITDGELTEVDLKEVNDEQEEESKNDGTGNEGSQNDGSGNSSSGNGGSGSSKSEKDGKSINTGDTNSVFKYLFGMIAAMAAMIITRKRVRR